MCPIVLPLCLLLASLVWTFPGLFRLRHINFPFLWMTQWWLSPRLYLLGLSYFSQAEGTPSWSSHQGHPGHFGFSLPGEKISKIVVSGADLRGGILRTCSVEKPAKAYKGVVNLRCLGSVWVHRQMRWFRVGFKIDLSSLVYKCVQRGSC